MGSLLVAGYNPDGDLAAIGQVGTGFSATTRRRLLDQLQPLRRATAPVTNRVELPGVRFVEPRFVAEIAYREYVPGRWLRHASCGTQQSSTRPQHASSTPQRRDTGCFLALIRDRGAAPPTM